jgi:hypothetical protein
MKPIRPIGAGVLLLLLGVVAPTYAQQEQHKEEAKPEKQEQQAKPEKQQEQAKTQQQQQQKEQQQAKGQQEHQQQQQAKTQQQQQQKEQQQAKGQQEHQQQAKNQQEQHQQVARQSPQEQHQQAHEQQAAWQQDRAHNWQSEHRTWQQRGGYNGYRIPEDRYHSYFGPSHGFRIYSEPVVIVGGFPRFQYQGFWFGFVDPWPEYWAANWYENDDVYVEYVDGGYYMYNRQYPRDRLAISVSLN